MRETPHIDNVLAWTQAWTGKGGPPVGHEEGKKAIAELAVIKAELSTAKELVDGAKNIVELHDSVSPAQSEWRAEWLRSQRTIKRLKPVNKGDWYD